MKSKFKVGDVLKVSDDGEQYNSYIKWFQKNAPELLVEYIKWNSDFISPYVLDNGDIVTLIKSGYFSSDCKMILWAVKKQDGRISLISEDGLCYVIGG